MARQSKGALLFFETGSRLTASEGMLSSDRLDRKDCFHLFPLLFIAYCLFMSFFWD